MMAIPSGLFASNSTSAPSSASEVYGNVSSVPTAPLCPDWLPVPMTTVIPAIYSVICVLGTLGNALAVYVLACGNPLTRTVANTFMLNLCVSDLLFLLSLPFWASYYSRGYSWHFGQVACKICGALLHLNLYASIFFITCMSVDRYLAIVHPFLSQRSRDCERARIVCVLVWVLAFACSAPNLALRDLHHLKELNVTACVISYPDHNWLLTLNWMKVILGFLLPLLGISCCYGAIGRHLLAYRGPARLQNSPLRQEGCFRSEQTQTPSVCQNSCTARPTMAQGVERILWTVGAVVMAFFLCWFPFHCVTFLNILHEVGWLDSCWVTWTIRNLTPLTLCLGFSNSAINPVLYCFVGNHFRGRLGDLCKGLCACLKAHGEQHSGKRDSFSTRLSSFSRKLSDLKDLAIVDTSVSP
ncbi:type-2 angiotensin II receptor [Fundulus heteroclitus]|uniref:type-2 angiotensin II receptor n=1 Tax=Fundulus heteroclitus TaxID=8078 RepID=UPI00165AF684|nr:type-2 angiotensin II receptor [Fundulus heteroclitus]